MVSVASQADLLGISRASVYYQPQPISEADSALLNEIDRIYTACPFYGVRRITAQSKRDGLVANHKRVHRLMQVLGIEAVYPKPNLSKNSQVHPVYPYLLKGLVIDHPNQVWGTDITYIRLQQGFVYLVAFLDWFSRYVVSWALSTTMEAAFCIGAAKEALAIAVPEITNSDQGVQFTSTDYLAIWQAHAVAISMDHRGRCFDNIFTERLWRNVKYEDVYLKDYADVKEAKTSLGQYFDFYNNRRLHQSLNYQTPAEIYFTKKRR